MNTYYQVQTNGRALEEMTCRHKHKTLEAAEKCRDDLLNATCNHGHKSGSPCSRCGGGRAHSDHWSAEWHNSRVVALTD